MKLHKGYMLIITVVNKGWSEKVIHAAKEAGATGATVLYGRGSGLENVPSLFGIPIDPEKEIVLNVVPEADSDPLMERIGRALTLCAPGTGVTFSLPVASVGGIYTGKGDLCELPPE